MNMRKLLSLVVMATLAITACTTPVEPGDETPGATEPVGTVPLGTEPAITEPVGTEPAGTEPPMTEPAGTEPAGTEPAITVEPTEPVGTPVSTEVATEPAGTEPAGTEEVPETGAVDPGLASNLLDLEVWNQNGTLAIGNVEEMILDFESGGISYIVVAAQNEETGDRFVPVPFVLFTWDDAEMKFILDIDQESFDNAPELEDGEIPDTTQPIWDAEFSQYWQVLISELEVTPTP